MTVDDTMVAFNKASLAEAEAMLALLNAKDAHALFLAMITWEGTLVMRNAAWDVLMAEFRAENA